MTPAIRTPLEHALILARLDPPGPVEALARAAVERTSELVAAAPEDGARAWLADFLDDAPRCITDERFGPAVSQVRDTLLKRIRALALAGAQPQTLLLREDADPEVIEWASTEEQRRVIGEMFLRGLAEGGVAATGGPRGRLVAPAWESGLDLPAAWRTPSMRTAAAVATLALVDLRPAVGLAPGRAATRAAARCYFGMSDERAEVAACEALAASVREVARELARGEVLDDGRRARLWRVIDPTLAAASRPEAPEDAARRPAATRNTPQRPAASRDDDMPELSRDGYRLLLDGCALCYEPGAKPLTTANQEGQAVIGLARHGSTNISGKPLSRSRLALERASLKADLKPRVSITDGRTGAPVKLTRPLRIVGDL